MSNFLAAFGIVLFGCVMFIAMGWTIGSEREIHRNGTEERLKTENAHCARSGGRLFRGQGREYICVDPRGVKWSRVR